MTAERRSRATEAFFGRRRGKKLRPRALAALNDSLPRYRLDLDAPAPASLAALYAVPVSEVRLEIGFGGGEHLLHEAGRNPGVGFIGVEPFVDGMAKFMRALDSSSLGRDAGAKSAPAFPHPAQDRTPLPNIRVHDDDATAVLDWLPDACLSGIDLLYPDPWPKKRHWKRRFVNAANLDRFARVLKPGGRFRFASDIAGYINWTLLHCQAHAAFDWQAGRAADWRSPYEGWPGTRYEAKAVREGRDPAYLTFIRK